MFLIFYYTMYETDIFIAIVMDIRNYNDINKYVGNQLNF